MKNTNFVNLDLMNIERHRHSFIRPNELKKIKKRSIESNDDAATLSITTNHHPINLKIFSSDSVKKEKQQASKRQSQDTFSIVIVPKQNEMAKTQPTFVSQQKLLVDKRQIVNNLDFKPQIKLNQARNAMPQRVKNLNINTRYQKLRHF